MNLYIAKQIDFQLTDLDSETAQISSGGESMRHHHHWWPFKTPPSPEHTFLCLAWERKSEYYGSN